MLIANKSGLLVVLQDKGHSSCNLLFSDYVSKTKKCLENLKNQLIFQARDSCYKIVFIESENRMCFGKHTQLLTLKMGDY